MISADGRSVAFIGCDDSSTIPQNMKVGVVPIEGGDYLIDHTATIFLMDADGRFFGALAHGEADDTSRAKLRRLVGA